MNNYPEIIKIALEASSSKQSEDLLALDMRGIVSYTDYFVIASGDSPPQVRAIAHEVMKRMKDGGFKILHVEGLEEAGWVLIDYGEMIVHVFMSGMRAFYEIEKLWADAPVVYAEDPP